MAEATTRAANAARPWCLCIALLIVLVGLSLAVTGLVLEDTTMIVTGVIAGGGGSIAASTLANAVNRWRRRSSARS
jgi:NAD/NADP transhydrogenase beta subunit